MGTNPFPFGCGTVCCLAGLDGDGMKLRVAKKVLTHDKLNHRFATIKAAVERACRHWSRVGQFITQSDFNPWGKGRKDKWLVED